MAMLGIKVNVDGPLKAFQNLRRDQLPYTIARALTMAAVAGQAVARKLEGQVFRLRNDWTTRNTKVAMASKTNLTATLYTDTDNRKTGAPDYLLPQEQGQEKVPHNGHTYIAVPTRYLLNLTMNGVRPDWLRPRTMLLGSDMGPLPTKGLVRKAKQMRAASQNGWTFFTQKLKGGELAIFGRHSGDSSIYPMYLLVTEAHIAARFPMETEVEKVVTESFPEIFAAAATEVIGNDLLRGSGLRIKL